MATQRPMFRYINSVPVYNVWDNDFEIIRTGKFCKLFQSQIQNENVIIGNLCIFDCTNEGIGSSDIEGMLASISADFPSLEVRVLFNIPKNDYATYAYRSFSGHMVAHCRFVSHVRALNINWKTLAINKCFISLQRRASLSRVKFTKKLLDLSDKERYIVSCGSQPNKWLHELTNLKEAFIPYILPILVDGQIDTFDKQHFHTDTSFFQCFVNVITETSSQTDDGSWREVFLTEKTFKAFAYRQLPIWFAVPNTVQSVRDLGFDVFDDIIDHSYDLIVDEDLRMQAVANTLKEFCNKYTIQELNDLRLSLWKRISSNMQLLVDLEALHAQTKHNHLLELLK